MKCLSFALVPCLSTSRRLENADALHTTGGLYHNSLADHSGGLAIPGLQMASASFGLWDDIYDELDPGDRDGRAQADSAALAEYQRLARSEAYRFSHLRHAWFVVTPESSLPLASECEVDESWACGTKVIEAIRDEISLQAPEVSAAESFALAERAAYACGQGMSNAWWGYMRYFTYTNQNELECSIYITHDKARAAPDVSAVVRSVWREGTCKDGVDIWSFYNDVCPRFSSCLVNEVTGRDIDPFPRSHWLITPFSFTNLKEARMKKALWYDSHGAPSSVASVLTDPVKDCYEALATARVRDMLENS